MVFLPLHVHVVLYKKYDSVIELGACCRHFGCSKGNLNSQLVDSNIITTPSTITGTVGIALRTCICSCTTYFYNSGIPHILHCRWGLQFQSWYCNCFYDHDSTTFLIVYSCSLQPGPEEVGHIIELLSTAHSWWCQYVQFCSYVNYDLLTQQVELGRSGHVLREWRSAVHLIWPTSSEPGLFQHMWVAPPLCILWPW